MRDVATPMASEPGSVAEAWARLESRGWLAECSAPVRALLAGIARLRSFEAGDSLFFAGDAPDGVYGLVEGELDISIPRLDGEECLAHRAETGFWVGDLALFARQKRLVGVRAATACRVVHLPQDELARLVGQHPCILADFYTLTHANMATALRILGNLAVTGAENRVALRLLMQADSQAGNAEWLHLSQASLAEIVALSEQSVRRSLHSLQDRGLIEAAYSKVRIIDREALARFCGYTAAGRRY